MAYQYKRRRPSIIRNFWIYRRMIGLAVLLGLMLWFIWANDAAVTVAFPFRLGHLNSSLGIVILLSALVGSLTTILIMTIIRAVRRLRGGQEPSPAPAVSVERPIDDDDRPPSDYAAKATDGISNPKWNP